MSNRPVHLRAPAAARRAAAASLARKSADGRVAGRGRSEPARIGRGAIAFWRSPPARGRRCCAYPVRRWTAAAGRSYSVVELVTDDMPFMVDTLYLTLGEAGYAVQLISHPILGAVRGANGRLLHFRERGRGRAPISESWQYLRIDRVAERAGMRRTAPPAAGGAARRALRLRGLAGDAPSGPGGCANSCCASHRRCPAAMVAESAALLAYMEDNHFTFLGFRRSSPAASRQRAPSRSDPGHGAGHHALASARRSGAAARQARAAGGHQGQSPLDRASSGLPRLHRHQGIRPARPPDRRGAIPGSVDLEHLPRRPAHRAADAPQGGAS